MLKNEKYEDIWDVFEKTRFLVGPMGARCTTELKKELRNRFQNADTDIQVFGYDAGELKRACDFRKRNFEIILETPLIDQGVTKADCLALLKEVGIEIPVMYKLGFRNNNCFHGDEKLITKEGIKSFKETVGRPVKVLGFNGRWKDAEIKSFGRQEMVELHLKRYRENKVIRTTAEHRWFIKKGVSGRREVLTHELNPSDKLLSLYGFLPARIRPSPIGICHGIVFGDGTINSSTLGGSARVMLCGDSRELERWFPEPCFRKDTEVGLEVRDLPRGWKRIPDLDEASSYLYGWLVGYFAADGCFSRDGQAKISSVRRENLEFVRDLCAMLGIGAEAVRKNVRTNSFVDGEHTMYEVSLNAYFLREDFFLLEKHRSRFVTRNRRKPFGWTVERVVPTSKEDEVYCAYVPDGNVFALDRNIYTGNCIGCVKGGTGVVININ